MSMLRGLRKKENSSSICIGCSFFVFLLKTVMFFLCTAEHYSIINPVLLQKFKGYNKENGKPDESLGRKARRG